MPDIEMPPQYAGHYHDPQDTEGHVARAITLEGKHRLSLWLPMTLDAVDEFESHALYRTDQLEYEHGVEIDINPVLASFARDVFNRFLPTTTVVSIAEGMLEAMMSDYEDNLSTSLSGAKQQLKGSILALVQAARKQATTAVSELSERMAESVEDAMTWVDSASTDPGYVADMCNWMGLIIPSRKATINPIRQSLENPFFGVYQSVRAQLMKAQGVPGLDDDDFYPPRWQREAVESQRKLYQEYERDNGGDGSGAWDAAYNY